MKTLIAVVTAHPRKHWRDAIRNTWLPFLPKEKADVKFFMGRGLSSPLADEVILDCDDTYFGLPEKIRAIARWAVYNGYDYMLKCDDDVVLHTGRLLASGYEQHKYSGKLNRHPCPQHAYPVPVGFNYWLSRECMTIVAGADLPQDLDNDDEKWVASKLFAHGITLHSSQGYELHAGDVVIEKPPSRIYRPLRPPKIEAKYSSGTFSWSIFLEANSGNGIPVEDKIAEFYKVFGKMYN